MKYCSSLPRLSLFILTILSISGFPAAIARAEPAVKLAGQGTLEFNTEGPSGFVLDGNASHLGKYTGRGEVEFMPGEDEGTFEGLGVVALKAANGDRIVGIVTWFVDADGAGQIEISWRDSVTFSDGTVVASTGRFAKSRPAGVATRSRFI